MLKQDSFSEIFEPNTRTEFRDMIPDHKYEFVIIDALKQLKREFNIQKIKDTSTKRNKWYVRFVGYYTTSSAFCRFGTDVTFYAKEYARCQASFSGYGFFDKFTYCPDKQLDGLKEDDAIVITFERKMGIKDDTKLGKEWGLYSIRRIPYKELPAKAQTWGSDI